MTQDVQERDTEWLLLRLVPKQAVCRFLIKRRRLSCRLSCFRETLCSLQSTWQTRESATRGSSRAPPCHPDTPALGDAGQSRQPAFSVLSSTRGVTGCYPARPHTTARQPGPRPPSGQTSSKQKPQATSGALFHCGCLSTSASPSPPSSGA